MTGLSNWKSPVAPFDQFVFRARCGGRSLCCRRGCGLGLECGGAGLGGVPMEATDHFGVLWTGGAIWLWWSKPFWDTILVGG